MASELKPDTVKKKRLATETLPQFLARMTLVWEDRQRRLAEAPARAVEATRRALAKLDPEERKVRQRAASKRYAEKHPDRIREKERRRSAVVSEERAAERANKDALKSFEKLRKAAERGAKRVSRPEGYPKDQPKPHRSPDASHAVVVARQPDLSRAWFGGARMEDACPDKPAVPASPGTSGLGRRAAKRRESQKSAAAGETRARWWCVDSRGLLLPPGAQLPRETAVPASPGTSGLGRRAAKRRESQWSAAAGETGPPRACLLAND